VLNSHLGELGGSRNATPYHRARPWSRETPGTGQLEKCALTRGSYSPPVPPMKRQGSALGGVVASGQSHRHPTPPLKHPRQTHPSSRNFQPDPMASTSNSSGRATSWSTPGPLREQTWVDDESGDIFHAPDATAGYGRVWP
jgi:hypothetical protein